MAIHLDFSAWVEFYFTLTINNFLINKGFGELDFQGLGKDLRLKYHL